MSKSTRQHGFLLPLVTALMTLFAGVWLLSQQPLTAAERTYRAAVLLQQELLFWHRGVLHYHHDSGYWPTDLTAVAQRYGLPPASISLGGAATLDGFNLVVVGGEKNTLNRVLLPLKDYFTATGDGNFYLHITTASRGADDPRYIERLADAPVLVSSDISFAGYSLHAAEVAGAKASFDEIRSRNLSGELLKALTLNANDITADDILVAGHSLVTQQQRLAQLYESLWYCVRVSKDCLESPQVM